MTASLPATWARHYNRLEGYGLLIILALLATGALQRIIGPALGQLGAYFSAFGL